MDPLDNPYAAGAGNPPPALVGRETEIEAFGVLLERLNRGMTGRSMLLTGLRGVGKTVLLNELERVADEATWQFVHIEVGDDMPLAQRLAVGAYKALTKVSPPSKWKQATAYAGRVVRSFQVTFTPDGTTVGFGALDSEEGKADTGLLEEDLIDVFEALGAAARDNATGIVFAIDELHIASVSELGALIAATHRATQLKLPITVVGAGLPHLKASAMTAKPYSERMFDYPELGVLTRENVHEAIAAPAEPYSLEFSDEALDRVFELSEGYPFFVQAYGTFLWNAVSHTPVTVGDVEAVRNDVEAWLDDQFFSARLAIASPLHLACLAAWAVHPAGAPYDVNHLLNVAGVEDANLHTIVEELRAKGFIYDLPDGTCLFSVPQFAEHLVRVRQGP